MTAATSSAVLPPPPLELKLPPAAAVAGLCFFLFFLELSGTPLVFNHRALNPDDTLQTSQVDLSTSRGLIEQALLYPVLYPIAADALGLERQDRLPFAALEPGRLFGGRGINVDNACDVFDAAFAGIDRRCPGVVV